MSSNGATDSGHFTDVWDISAGDLVLKATVDLNGIKDEDPGPQPYDWACGDHAWSELGVRSVGYGNFNPTWKAEGAGVWLSTDYDEYWEETSPGVWEPLPQNTFAPDPVGAPTQDMDDKLILQKGGGWDEGTYDLPGPGNPPAPWDNHRVWFDRDGVDQWQAQSPLMVDGGTYNTKGKYDVEIKLHAVDAANGTAYMKINGLDQGFETDVPPNWDTMEFTPAGMTFTGDMKQMQVFYGLYGYGADHSVTFKDITVTGVRVPQITWGNPADIVYGTPLGAAQLNAAATSGGDPVPGTFTYTPPAGTVLNAGTHTLKAEFVPTDTDSFTSVSKEVTINVVKANTTTVVTSSYNPACCLCLLLGKKVTLTATVSPVAPGAGTPDGTVTFYKKVCGKKTAIGTATLVNGKATLNVSLKDLCLLANSITAEYSGSGNFTGSASPVLIQWVL